MRPGGQAGSLPTAARSLDPPCSLPWLIIAVSVEMRWKGMKVEGDDTELDGDRPIEL